MNEVYRNIMITQIAGAVAKAEAAIVHHQGLKGQFREIILRDMLRPLLPRYIGIGTGEIITSDNRHSKQQDVIIYDSRILPPILLDQSIGIFPIESVLATVEVKSKLTASEIKTSYESAQEIKQFPISSGFFNSRGFPLKQQVPFPIPCIFAFSTDLKKDGKTEIERLSEIAGYENGTIRAICVARQGVWLHTRLQNGWHYSASDGNFSEILQFLATLIHTYEEVSRGRGRPRLGEYLIDPRSSK